MSVALVVTTDNEMSLVKYSPPDYSVIRDAVGGHYEHVKINGFISMPTYSMMVNEEGQLLGLPINRLGSFLYGCFVHGNYIVGDIILVKNGYYNSEPDIVGMSEDEAKFLGDGFITLTSGRVRWKNPPQTGGQTHG